MTTTPIDAVITWVDGQDQAHQDKLARYLASTGKPRPQGADPTRFNQCGEIDYCVKSLLRFAPWIRTIFIVTDNQVPPIIHTLKNTPYENKVRLVNHQAIFSGFDNALPTFNSLTIETLLWRIEGLSTQFIYLNDDCALLRPVTPHDFFRDNKLVLRGEWKTHTEKKWRNRCRTFLKHPLNTSNPHRALQENTAKLAGWENKFFHLPHAALPLNKETFQHFFYEHPEQLSQNIQYRVRNPKQFWPISLAQHLDIKHHQVIFDNTLHAVSINGACHGINKIQTRLCGAAKNKATFICVQSLDLAPALIQQFVLHWLDERIMR